MSDYIDYGNSDFRSVINSNFVDNVITETEILEWIKNNLKSFFEEIINGDK